MEEADRRCVSDLPFGDRVWTTRSRKKDFKAAQEDYTEELKMYTDDQSKSQGLVDTLQLAQAYSQPGATQDLPKAVWYLYARVWAYAPPAYKAQIEPKLEYYYKKYHGSLDGLDAAQAAGHGDNLPAGNVQYRPRQESRPSRFTI